VIVRIGTESEDLRLAIRDNRAYIEGETLTKELVLLDTLPGETLEVGDYLMTLEVQKTESL
jgi:hypothetical protein